MATKKSSRKRTRTKRKSSKKSKSKELVRTERTLNYVMDGNNHGIIDLGRDLSRVNRKGFAQGRRYHIERITLTLVAFNSDTPSQVGIQIIPDNYVTANAWVKAKAQWDEMNNLILSRNPSIRTKWHDFKTQFSAAQAAGTLALLDPVAFVGASGDQVLSTTGEWEISECVFPQHDVDPTTGLPLAADVFKTHMLGDDLPGAGSPDLLTSGGIIKMYQDTRAYPHVSPEVPADMSKSWGTTLRDFGSSMPELGDILESAGDFPPYDTIQYIGGDDNVDSGYQKAILMANTANNIDNAPGFYAPCGLLQITDGLSVSSGLLQLHLSPGTYKGVHAPPMRQA